MYRLDSFVGAVTGGFRSEFRHDQCREERSACRHQWDRPRTVKTGGPLAAALAGGRRDVIVRKITQQELTGVFQPEIEDDGAQAGDDTNSHPEYQPLL